MFFAAKRRLQKSKITTLIPVAFLFAFVLPMTCMGNTFNTLKIEPHYKYISGLCLEITPSFAHEDYDIHFKAKVKDIKKFTKVEFGNITHGIFLNEHVNIQGNEIRFYLPVWTRQDRLRLCFHAPGFKGKYATLHLTFESYAIKQHSYVMNVNKR